MHHPRVLVSRLRYYDRTRDRICYQVFRLPQIKLCCHNFMVNRRPHHQSSCSRRSGKNGFCRSVVILGLAMSALQKPGAMGERKVVVLKWFAVVFNTVLFLIIEKWVRKKTVLKKKNGGRRACQCLLSCQYLFWYSGPPCCCLLTDTYGPAQQC